ncbi:MAG: DUF3017 domain-containing protein [Micrococcales bacterium]|nr:DUF3017 domain-containing protein [Micrococcales bacterium]
MTKLDQSVVPTNEVPVYRTPPRGVLRDGLPTEAPDALLVDQPGERQGLAWLVVTTLGVVVAAGVGAVTTARVGALTLAVLVVGCAVVRAVVEPGPAALSVRSRRTDVLVLGFLAVALGVVAIRLPAV